MKKSQRIREIRRKLKGFRHKDEIRDRELVRIENEILIQDDKAFRKLTLKNERRISLLAEK